MLGPVGGRTDHVEQMSVAAMRNMLDDLKRTLEGAEQTQRRVMRVTATVTSDDRMIKATVGPRGQLVHLEIDPRVYRRPNAVALAEAIVATVRAAADKAMADVQDILAESLPRDMTFRNYGSLDLQRLMRSHDADLAEEESDVEPR
jgi:DNA-binding protein YbaB